MRITVKIEGAPGYIDVPTLTADIQERVAHDIAVEIIRRESIAYTARMHAVLATLVQRGYVVLPEEQEAARLEQEVARRKLREETFVATRDHIRKWLQSAGDRGGAATVLDQTDIARGRGDVERVCATLARAMLALDMPEDA